MIENIIGSTTKVKMLRLFFEYPNRAFSTKEIFSNAIVGRGYAGKCLKMLADEGIIQMKKVGKEKRYVVNKESRFYESLKAFFDQEKIRFSTFNYTHRSLIADLAEQLINETIIIFGSVAAGTALPDSDIDILIIGDNENRIRSVCKTLEKKYKIDIQEIILTKEKLEKMIQQKSSLIKNISKENVFIKGNKKILEMIG